MNGSLLTRNRFAVYGQEAFSLMANGQIEFVQIQPEAGSECRLRNPWPGKTVTARRKGKKDENVSGSLLESRTAVSETATVVLEGARPSRKEIPR